MKLLFNLVIILYSVLIEFNLYVAEDVGQKLFLTPLIEHGQLKYAKRLSRVNGLPAKNNENLDDIISYSGFFTVDKTFNSNIFFWFFPALDKNPMAPTLVWLQGGPGGSSMFGILLEHGPLQLNDQILASRRNITWAEKFNMLYIDQPVGTGFSFTDNDKGYANNEDDVARDLYEALQQFFTLFSEYRNNDLYLTGESYAGKYVPALGYKIHSMGDLPNMKLKGLAIGDGNIDPINQLVYGDYMYHVGLIDENQRDRINKIFAWVKQLIKKGKFMKAYKIRDKFFDEDLPNFTGLRSLYNYRVDSTPEYLFDYEKYVKKARKQLHVGNQSFIEDGEARNHLLRDIMQSIKDKLVVLMNDPRYKFLFYYGQLDLIDNYAAGRNFLWNLDWINADKYHKSGQTIWKVGNRVAGYVKQVERMTLVVVRDSGHMVPIDKPIEALDMITKFVHDQYYY